MKKTIIFGIILMVFLLVGCSQQQTQYVCPDGSTVSDTSYCPKPNEEPEQKCTVQDRGEGYSCFDGGLDSVWAWKGKICDITRGYIITESVSCINNKCEKDETIIKNCKNHGSNWICGYRTGQEVGDTVCAKPDWSEIIDV